MVLICEHKSGHCKLVCCFVGITILPVFFYKSIYYNELSTGPINRLIFQDVLSRSNWQNILTVEDKRALNVLFHSHINPYGLFPLDLSKRFTILLDKLKAETAEYHKDQMVGTKQRQKEEALV